MKKTTTSNKKMQVLNEQEMLMVKGGFREMPGQRMEVLTTRWDEIDLRFQDGTSSHTIGKPTTGNTTAQKMGALSNGPII
ncbi:MAG: hypothetical protein R2795_13460 [Saprospiraceae bacterium]